jgi:transcriptional regulator with XRE-family HTH domain
MSIEKPMIGAALAKLIREEQEKRELNLAEMAELLGMSKPYLAALLSGERQIDKLSYTYLESIAIFLDLPKAQVYNLAEILSPEDYIYKESIEGTLDDLQRRMKGDASWMHLSPTDEEWAAMNMKTKLLISYMYETVTHAKTIKAINFYKFE